MDEVEDLDSRRGNKGNEGEWLTEILLSAREELLSRLPAMYANFTGIPEEEIRATKQNG